MIEEKPGTASRDSSADVPIARRSLLRTVPVLGAMALAGCGGLTNQTFSASRVALGDESMSDLGLEEITRTTRSDSVSRDVGPVSGSVTAETKLTVYSMSNEGEHPEEGDIWQGSEAPLASWANNSPVRGVGAADALDARDLNAKVEDTDAESIPADEASILVPDEATGDGPVDPEDALILAHGSGIDWGDAESGGSVSPDSPVRVIDFDGLLPDGVGFPGRWDGQ